MQLQFSEMIRETRDVPDLDWKDQAQPSGDGHSI